MKTHRFITVIACALGLLTTSVLWAAKAGKKQADPNPAVPAAKYDADNNGLLDPKEKEALAKAFKDGSNPAIKRYDLDGDGELTKEEIDQISLKSDVSSSSSSKKGKKEKKEKRNK